MTILLIDLLYSYVVHSSKCRYGTIVPLTLCVQDCARYIPLIESLISHSGLNEEEEDENDEEEGEEEEDAGGVKASGKRPPASSVQYGVRETESSVNHRASDKKRAEEGKKGKGDKQGRKKEGGLGASKKSTRAPKRRDGHAHMIGEFIKNNLGKLTFKIHI